MVPKTMARYSWMPLLPSEIQAITRKPQTTPMAASMLRALRERNPNRNRPSIPPEKMLESFHHESRMLSTFTRASEIRIPSTPMTRLERRSTRRACPSEWRGATSPSTFTGLSFPLSLSLLQKSLITTVAPEVILVDTVLMPAAKMLATSNPVKPVGRTLTMK